MNGVSAGRLQAAARIISCRMYHTYNIKECRVLCSTGNREFIISANREEKTNTRQPASTHFSKGVGASIETLLTICNHSKLIFSAAPYTFCPYFRHQITCLFIDRVCTKKLGCKSNKFEKMHSNSRFVPLVLETDTNLT